MAKESIKWPAHAYVPGMTTRHPDDAFATIRCTASHTMSTEALARSDAFRFGLAYLDNGYYWEAHEVLEAVWLALPEHSEEKKLVQALIQVANAHLKKAMNRPNAVRRLCAIANRLFDELSDTHLMGVDRLQYEKKLLEIQE